MGLGDEKEEEEEEEEEEETVKLLKWDGDAEVKGNIEHCDVLEGVVSMRPPYRAQIPLSPPHGEIRESRMGTCCLCCGDGVPFKMGTNDT